MVVHVSHGLSYGHTGEYYDEKVTDPGLPSRRKVIQKLRCLH